MKTAPLALAILFALPAVASAQSPAEQIKGRWVAEGGYCAPSVYEITGVDPNGTVHGVFICTKTNWKPALGNVINREAVKATLTGNRFVMINLDGGGTDVVLNGAKLEGKGRVRAGSPETAVTYVRQ